jgi:hypothetical protein
VWKLRLRGSVRWEALRARAGFGIGWLPLEQVRSSALWCQIVDCGGCCVLPDVKFVARVN